MVETEPIVAALARCILFAGLEEQDLAALDAHGPCVFHRRSFAPVRIAGDA